MSGEETWSSGGKRAADLHGATTRLFPADQPGAATVVDARRRSRLARAAIPLAILLLAAGIGLGAWVGSRAEDVQGLDAQGAEVRAPPRSVSSETPEAPRDPPAADAVEPAAQVAEERVETPDAQAAEPRRASRRRAKRPPTRAPETHDAPDRATVEPGMLLGAERFPEER